MFAEPHRAGTSPDLMADAHESVVNQDKNPGAADSVGFSINERDSKAHLAILGAALLIPGLVARGHGPKTCARPTLRAETP